MFQSNKIHDNVLHNNFAPNYIFDVENSNDIENANYSFQFWGTTTQVLKGEHNLAYNNNYVSESFSISEWNLYGSSRLGTRNIDKVADVVFLASRNYNWVNSTVTNEYIAPTASFTYKKYRLLGAKTFELTNHLGNVITTISDRKLMVEDQQNIGFVHHYKPEILSIGEQYAFGMSMPGRTFSVEDYRYGFNGKENQDELLGEDNSQDFGARIYDARVGRWWGLDPCYYKFAYTTPYNFSLNNPLYYVDHDGLEPTVAGRIGLGDYIKYLNENDVTQLTALMNIHGGYFGTSILGKKGSQTTHRYLYSPKWGWIDMTHFAMGAALSSLNPVTPDMALRWLENHERDNKDPGSTFDYEDLVSNLLGVYFYEYLSEQKDNTKSLIENLDDYLTKLGFVDNPVRYAPNIIPEDHHGGVEPQNRTYNPSFTYKNSQNWYNGLDLKIVKFKNKFMEGKDQDRKYVTKGPKSSQSKPKGGTPKKNAEPKQKGSTPKKKAEPKRKSRPKF